MRGEAPAFAAEEWPEDRSDRKSTVWGVYFVTAGNPWFETACAMERRIICDEFDYQSSKMCREYRPYDDRSTFSCLIHHPSRQLVATSRVISGDYSDLKTASDLESIDVWGRSRAQVEAYHDLDFDVVTVTDVASLVIDPDWRSYDGLLPAKLAVAMVWLTALHFDSDILIADLDVRMDRIIRMFMGLSFERICDLPDFVEANKPSLPGLFRMSGFWFEYRTKSPEVDAVVRGDLNSVPGGISLPALDLRRIRRSNVSARGLLAAANRVRSR